MAFVDVYKRQAIPPDVVYFPTSGGILSLSVFTGPVHAWGRVFYFKIGRAHV